MRKKAKIDFRKSFFFIVVVFALLQVISFLMPDTFIKSNSGFIFGQLNNNLVAIFLLIAAVFSALILFKQDLMTANQLWLALLLSGLLSNLFERLFYGGVIDYINIWIIPTFNLADLLIVVSIIIITTKVLYNKKSASL